MVKTLCLPIVVLGLLTLTACASTTSSQALTGSPWLLTELGGKAPLAEISITAEFDDVGRMSGSSGCNSYSTSYRVDGNQIEFDEQMVATLMACPDPVMAQERLYLEVLLESITFEIVNSELILHNADGDVLAKFQAVSQDLAGTSWDVISYNTGTQAVRSVIIGTEITANFSDDGRLSGNASCNQYTTTYKTDGVNITIGPAVVTEMYCEEPEGVMEQEGHYLAALQTADTYKIQGPNMEMRTSEGSLVASFMRIDIP